MTIDCPNIETCGGEWEFDIYQDSDGDGAWARSWTAADPVGQSCSCALSDDELMRLQGVAIELAAEAGAPDV